MRSLSYYAMTKCRERLKTGLPTVQERLDCPGLQIVEIRRALSKNFDNEILQTLVSRSSFFRIVNPKFPLCSISRDDPVTQIPILGDRIDVFPSKKCCCERPGSQISHFIKKTFIFLSKTHIKQYKQILRSVLPTNFHKLFLVNKSDYFTHNQIISPTIRLFYPQSEHSYALFHIRTFQIQTYDSKQYLFNFDPKLVRFRRTNPHVPIPTSIVGICMETTRKFDSARNNCPPSEPNYLIWAQSWPTSDGTGSELIKERVPRPWPVVVLLIRS